MENAIMKINTEMQKDASNEYLEIIGHYIIDRCTSDESIAKAVNDGKTLAGAMDAIKTEARKKAKGNCGVMKDREIFDAVDKYLNAAHDEDARAKSIASVDGGSAPVKSTPSLDLDFDSLI